MKTKFFALLIAASLFFNAGFASDRDPNVNATVLNSFSDRFEKASDISWSKTAGYYKANFTFNGQYLSAFYTEAGEFFAVSRNLVPNELPIFLSTGLLENYPDYWITELFEYNTKESSKYYITIESADKKLILESIDSKYWSVFKKSSKM